MESTQEQPEKNRSRYAYNMTVAAVAGQVGCLTLVIVLAALFGGLWLDTRFGTKPMITVVLMVASVPVTLVGMFWIVKLALSRLNSASPANSAPREGEN